MAVNTRELDNLIKKIKEVSTGDKVNRAALQIIHGLTVVRIFKQGRNIKNKSVGVYSKSYQKVRARENYPISKKVIFQAKGQMINDWVFIVEKGEYGSGFNQDINSDKSDWLEDKYDEKIWDDLTASEKKQIPKAYEQAIRQIAKF